MSQISVIFVNPVLRPGNVGKALILVAVASARVDFNVLVFVVAVVVTGTVTMCTTSTKCRKSTLSDSHIGTRLDCNANGREAVFLLVVMLPEPSLSCTLSYLCS